MKELTCGVLKMVLFNRAYIAYTYLSVVTWIDNMPMGIASNPHPPPPPPPPKKKTSHSYMAPDFICIIKISAVLYVYIICQIVSLFTLRVIEQ